MKSKLTFLEFLIITGIMISIGSVVYDIFVDVPAPVNKALERNAR